MRVRSPWAIRSTSCCRLGSRCAGRVTSKGAEGEFATQHDVSTAKRDIRAVTFRVAIPNPRRVLVPGMTVAGALARKAMTAEGPAIRIEHAVKQYGAFTAVNDVSSTLATARPSASSARMARARAR